MEAAYSYDLRLKVIKFLDEKKKIKEASKVFGISRKTIMEWKQLKKVTGDVKAKTGYHTGNRRIIKDTVNFIKFVEKNSDKSAKELGELWHQPVSASCIVRLLNKLGFSYKKKLYSHQDRRWVKE